MSAPKPGAAALAGFGHLGAATVLKCALKARGWRYCDLADAMGQGEPAVNIRNKVNRDTFAANWLLQALAAIDA